MVPLVLCRDVDKAGFEKFEVCRWRDLSQNAQLKLKCATWRPYDHTVRLDLYEINVLLSIEPLSEPVRNTYQPVMSVGKS